MSKVEIYVVVEGQTEQTFVREVLGPYMADKGIYLHPALIGSPGNKGGNVCFCRAKKDIVGFLKQRNETYVSTMFDYFRIDSQWPGRGEVQQQIQNGGSLPATQKAKIIEKATGNEIIRVFANAKSRFIPYIEMHEFEALLFSDAGILAEKTEIDGSHILRILENYNSPEEINDDPEKAPSKRLMTLNNKYRKIANGKMVSEAIGIQNIRKKCANFNNWLTKLEHLQGGC
jgi:hypothetical protein